ncbi:LysE/ArgO family amino acid transporter [Balneatrix alpica]|uniref:LysE/ArgO family amino acid transporter n=1 Tax=Balneatrix alpica TaxID=75684 RepID=A0ABV5ZFC3_9GAMM|nr:LysE/ArgO family amino acid transporter [Balneatrix alpica]
MIISWTPFWQGMSLSAALIIAIGAQNAWVLSQSIRGQHGLAIALVCTLSDWILIALGVMGVGSLLAQYPDAATLAAWLGGLFLAGYGVLSWHRALTREQRLTLQQIERAPWPKVLLITLAVTWLNPHAWLDTVVLIGGLGAQYSDAERPAFALGAMFISICWFLSLTLAGRWLAPYFQQSWTWKALDAGTGSLMLVLAWQLLPL